MLPSLTHDPPLLLCLHERRPWRRPLPGHVVPERVPLVAGGVQLVAVGVGQPVVEPAAAADGGAVILAVGEEGTSTEQV